MQVMVPDLKKKDAVHLTFRLPISDMIVDATGVVVWSSERRQGIKFESIGEQSRHSIRQFVKECSAR